MKLVNALKNIFTCINKQVLILTLVISAIAPLLIAWLAYPIIFNQIAEYHDFIAGDTVWNGYFKRGDLILFFVYFITYTLLLLILPFILNRLLKTKGSKKSNVFKEYNNAQLFLISAVVFGITVLTINKIFPLALLLVFFAILYSVLKNHDTDVSDVYTKFCLISVFAYFDMVAISVVASTIFEYSSVYDFLNVAENYLLSILAISILATAYAYTKKKITEKNVDKILLATQIILPALFIAFYQFRYYYQDVQIIQFHSDRLMSVCWLVALLMIFHNLFFCDRRRKKNEPHKLILTTTIVSLAAFVMFRIPNGVLLTDYFHNGESTVPLQQMFQFGSIPFIDYFPIHGMMEYALGIFNYVFFEGDYATFAASSVIASIVGAIILSLLIIRFTEGEVFPFILAIITANIGQDIVNRWFGIFILILILHNKKARKNPFMFLWWWILTSIIAIAWNPPIGGVASVSFLPMLVLSFIEKKEKLPILLKNELSNKRNLLFWGILFVIGIGFIPIFINLMTVLVANLGSTVEANGNSGTSAILQGAINFFDTQVLNVGLTLIIRPLGFVLVVALLMIIKYEKKERNIIDLGAIIQILLYVALISNYVFVRADVNFSRALWGTNTLMLAILAALAGDLFKNRTKHRYSIYLIPIMIAIAAGSEANGLSEQHKKFFTPPVINSEFISFNGDSEGIANLGTVFADQDEINYLIDINYVLTGTDTYLDWTNRVAFHYIFGKKTPVAISSIYATQAQTLHYKYLQSIQEEPPEIILLAPGDMHDGGTVAYRAYPIYRWAMLNGYSPFVHNNVVFLLSKNSSRRTLFQQANQEFMSFLHRKDLGFLPIQWGSSSLISNRLLPTGVSLTQIGSQQIDDGMITGSDGFLSFQFDAPVNGGDNDFLKVVIHSDYDLLEEDLFQVFWSNESEDFSEEKSVVFKGQNGVMLIPLGASPSYMLSNNIDHIRFDFPASMNGKAMPSVELSLYRYTD